MVSNSLTYPSISLHSSYLEGSAACGMIFRRIEEIEKRHLKTTHLKMTHLRTGEPHTRVSNRPIVFQETNQKILSMDQTIGRGGGRML